MTWLFGILGWLTAKAAGLAGSGIVQAFVGSFNKAVDGKVRLAELDAETAQVVFAGAAAAGTERQRIKLNMPVFVVMIAAMIGAPTTLLWAITLYNIFWWQNGVWPQDWSIAAYPPSVAHWVEMSIQWLYDPLGPPSAVGAAGVAAYVMGSRR